MFRLARLIGAVALVSMFAAGSLQAADSAGDMKKEDVLQIMQKVAAWQLANPSKHLTTEWTHGALYNGMMALGDISADPKFRDAMMAVGVTNQWKPGKMVYHADDHCVGQMYCEMYSLCREPRMIAPLRERFDYILANPSKGKVEEITSDRIMRWWWCDALFMGPPAWARLYEVTGEKKYLDFMVNEWWATSDFLFDRDEKLYFRDMKYFAKKETNGKKIFWSRGNGWVMGGLVRVLQILPSDHPERKRFVEQFQQMSDKLVACQQADGLWRSSLLDPESYPNPETSGSGFYCYAIAWGINQGLLDKAKFGPVMKKAWAGLVGCVAEDGKLTHVQPIGADPKKFETNLSEVYGIGAFLLAGSEVYRMQLLQDVPNTTMSAINDLEQMRVQETVEILIAVLKVKLQPATAENVAVMDSAAARWVTSQVVDENGDGTPDKLIFQTDLQAKQKKSFTIFAGVDRAKLPSPVLKMAARFVPERADDFAWENDRIAFRMYGPALVVQDGPAKTGSGVDVWCKHVRQPVMDTMYKKGNYHVDNGLGVDCYKVCPGCGCGGVAVWAQDKLCYSSDFKSWKILSAGPIRTVFELTYEDWDAAGRKVSEVKRVTLDLGSNFNRFESVFKADGSDPLTIAAGLNAQNSHKPGKVSSGEGYVTAWLPSDGKDNGMVGTAVILLGGTFKESGDQAVLLAPAKPGQPFVHYAGACWDKGLDFKDEAAWLAHVKSFVETVKAPVKVELQ